MPQVQTKLALPFASSTRLPRPALVAQLQSGLQNNHRLSLVTAPTGSGKTTLLGQWARSQPTASASFGWLALDEQDNDPLRFWGYFLSALEVQAPGPVQVARALLQGDLFRPAPVEQTLAVLINALQLELSPLVLVLDDYHVIHDLRIHAALQSLLDQMPPMLHLAIASRTEPPLNLALLRARGQLTELHLASLSFSEAEAGAFLNSAMHLELSSAQVTLLEQRTEGWIAGLQLAAIAMQSIRQDAPLAPAGHPQLDSFIQAFGGSHRHVLDYLSSEVLQRLPAELQDFLVQSSLLERLSGPLCNETLQRTSSHALLETIESLNLFLIPLDAERRWYRYHALWAEVLQTRLLSQHPDLIPELHGRAAAWFEKHGFLAEAIPHAIQAGQPQQAADWIEPLARSMVLRGEGSQFLHWLDQIAPALINERPQLVIAKAWAWITAGELDEIEALLEHLASPAGAAPAFQAEVAAVRAMVATLHQDIPVIQQQAALALQNLPASDSLMRAAMALSLGTAASLSGHALPAVDLFEQAIQASRLSHQSIIRLVSTTGLASAYESLGQLNQAARLHGQVIALESDPVLGSLPLIGVGYVGLGGILHEWLLFDQAEATLQKGLTIGQRWGSPEILIGGWFSLARLRYTQGHLDEALEILEKLEADFFSSTPLRERDHIQSIQARIWLAQGQLARAKAWEQTCDLDESQPVTYPDEQQMLVLVRVLLASQAFDKALRILTGLEQTIQADRRTGSLIEVMLLRVLTPALSQLERQSALEQALRLGEPHNQRRVFVDEPELLPWLQAHLSRHPHDRFAAQLLPAFELRLSALQPPPGLLSPRELEVLRLLAAGCSNQEIASSLVVALSTVKSHVKNILMKLDAENRTQAVAHARQLQIL
jgi:LuxR family maltose regulon positive regulatory protein